MPWRAAWRSLAGRQARPAASRFSGRPGDPPPPTPGRGEMAETPGGSNIPPSLCCIPILSTEVLFFLDSLKALASGWGSVRNDVQVFVMEIFFAKVLAQRKVLTCKRDGCILRGMFLIRPGEKPVPICRKCKALHSKATCPRRYWRNGIDPWVRRRYEELMALQATMKAAKVG